jgi:hypothetical protein
VIVPMSPAMIPETREFRPSPAVMLVAIERKLAQELMSAIYLPVLVVAHASAACPRMLATHPLAILVGDQVARTDLDALEETATSIGAEVLHLADHRDDPVAALNAAAQRVSLRRG